MTRPPPPPPPIPAQSSALRAMLHRGTAAVIVLGRREPVFGDTYYRLLHGSWPRLLGQFTLAFVAFNLVFATLYWLDPGGLQLIGGESDVPRFWRGFFFSVHTLVTIGYGNVVPRDLYTNLVVVAEAIVGVLGFAVTTGLVFARFARPTARVLFSDAAVVAPFAGVPAIQLRAVNQRHNLILSASARVALLRSVADDQGHVMRRFFDLDLVRDANPVFALSWTIVHCITPTSPFHGQTPAEIAASDDELIVIIAGTDESMAQTIHARTAYAARDLRWNMRFADILGETGDGRRTLDYARFNDVEPI